MRLFATGLLLLWVQTGFDVVSVKPNNSGLPPAAPVVSPGRFTWVNATLRQLIQVGYDKRPHQVIGMPEWADTSHFDVTATAAPGSSRNQMNAMLQDVLTSRFGLAVHRESRELPVYFLSLARRDGRLGRNLLPASVDCVAVAGQPVRQDSADCVPQMGLTRIKAKGISMAMLADGLMRIFDRSVLDRTGLAGVFDLELSWVPDPTMLPTGVPSTPSSGPSIFAALEEQLGLKVESNRAPIEVLVIDRLSRPTSD